MGLPKKFQFDVSFDQLEARLAARGKPREPTFSQAEIDAARAAGYASGRESAFAEAKEASDARLAAALERLSNGVAELLEASSALAAETQHQALLALRAIMHKIAPTLCSKTALAEIEALAVLCLHETIDEARVVLRVADEIYEPVKSRLDAMTAASGYTGRIVLLVDSALAAGDCRVEWADGGAERDTKRLVEEIDAVLVRTIDAVAPAAPTSLEETQHG